MHSSDFYYYKAINSLVMADVEKDADTQVLNELLDLKTNCDYDSINKFISKYNIEDENEKEFDYVDNVKLFIRKMYENDCNCITLRAERYGQEILNIFACHV